MGIHLVFASIAGKWRFAMLKTFKIKSVAVAIGLAAGISITDAAITIDLVNIGDVGNAADTTGYGSVGYSYDIGKYGVTIGQYASFLNAAAQTDPYGLYNINMGTDLNVAGITQSGSSGSYTYSVMSNGGDSTNRPISYVSWFDAARFANWLQNGQGSGSTETGAYTLNGATSGVISKNANATFWIPSENEWYKAAYYDPSKAGGGGYWLYPTQSDIPPGNTIGNTPNQANFYDTTFSVTEAVGWDTNQNYLTDEGAFSGSQSFYGTFDQGGNVFEWNDSVDGSLHGLRGGSWFIALNGTSTDMISTTRWTDDTERNITGFRVAAVPEPSTWFLLLLGVSAIFGIRKFRKA